MTPRLFAIARREWLEQRREPAMLAVVGALYALVAGLVVAGVIGLEVLAGDPAGAALVRDWLGTEPRALVGPFLLLFDFLAFSQLLGIAAVASGHAVLHDRQCGTLTFLLLAPVRRSELLVGKVLGAVGWPLGLYFAIVGAAAAALALVPITRGEAALTAASPGFWAAFALGAPAWAAAVASVGAVVSALARDVRTAQQVVWFVVFFATLSAGGLLTWGLSAGLAAELVVAALGAAAAAAVLIGGASLLSRDLTR